MTKIRVRVWPNGVLVATKRAEDGHTTRALEFDGRRRYHTVTVQPGFRETELRCDFAPGTRRPALFHKHTANEGKDKILTNWAELSTTGTKSSGSTLIHTDNTIHWTQKTARDGLSVAARGNGESSRVSCTPGYV